jgi:hypothetical protein
MVHASSHAMQVMLQFVLQQCSLVCRANYRPNLTSARTAFTGPATSISQLHAVAAQVVHDFGHGGRTNDFLVNSHNALAVIYNDR